MVSIMNEALQLEVGQKVLEVGAGSGWHSATIAEIIAPKDAPRSEWGHVYTTEIVQGLAEISRKNVMNAGYGDRVTIINADGSKGYPEKAPYDRVLVTAAAPDVPKPLIDELKPRRDNADSSGQRFPVPEPHKNHEGNRGKSQRGKPWRRSICAANWRVWTPVLAISGKA